MPIASPKRSQALVLPCRAPPGSRLYAVGDIHGRSDLLDRLHEAIAADARHCGAERVRIVYLGDYVDRGGDSAGVIERLVRPPPDGPRRVFLMGNHEAMMLAFLDGDLAQLDSWLWNGGMATLESYGVYPMAGEQGPGWAEAIRADLLKALPPAHAEFLRALQSHHR
ncbi:MAG: hypothetical protein FJX42_11965, partial [Alphaproteobacteria bacterium]|nr:hypothetical protein [Alphaproteobacteria bacterium]